MQISNNKDGYETNNNGGNTNNNDDDNLEPMICM